MELENLRDSWQANNAAHTGLDSHSEADWERISARVAEGRIQSSAQRLRRRWRLTLLLVLLLPCIWNTSLQLPDAWHASLHGGSPQLRTACWALLALFLASALTHTLLLLRTLDRCDPLENSVRSISEAVVRLRRTFLRSLLIQLPLAVALLVLIYLYHQGQAYHEAWRYGFWTGLAIGVPIGIHRFLQMLRDIDVLAKAVRELDA